MSINPDSERSSLRGQRVVVVGGTSGMGLGAARAAARAGAAVVIAGRRAVSGRDISPSDGSLPFEHAVVDVTDEASVRAMFDDLGQFDHLLVTAAPAPGSWDVFLKQNVKSAQSYMLGKFFGSWACARYAAPHLRGDGSITFLTGCTSIRPRRGLSIVTATFAALEAFSQALALELGPLRVNTIRPGVVDSDMWNFLDEPAREQLRIRTRENFPAHRVGTPDDIGHAAVFLMTNQYVTGAVLEVSGGEPLVSLET